MHSTLYRTHVTEFSPEWQAIREQVLRRACNRCERCRDLAPLEIHHKHYNTLGQEELP